MGLIDPMVINSAAATGVLELGGAHTIWLATMGVLAGATLGILLSAVNHVRATLPAMPRLPHASLLATGVVRGK